MWSSSYVTAKFCQVLPTFSASAVIVPTFRTNYVILYNSATPRPMTRSSRTVLTNPFISLLSSSTTANIRSVTGIGASISIA